MKQQSDPHLSPAKFLSEAEFTTLQQTLNLLRCREPRNVTMIEILMHTGCRVSEMLSLRLIDVDFSRGIFIRALKGSSSRTIPIPHALYSNILLHAAAYSLKPEDRLFPITYSTMFGIWRGYRPCKKALRSLRHNFGLRVYTKTKDLKLTQKALGHKSITNTMVYLDFVYEQEEFRKVLL